MNTDKRLQAWLTTELNKQPGIADFDLIVHNGSVLLRSLGELSLLEKSVNKLTQNRNVKILLIEKAPRDLAMEQTLAYRIADVLEQHPMSEMERITIEISDNGQLYLKGVSSCPSKRAAIGKTLWQVKGVNGICNLLTISDEHRQPQIRSHP